MTDWAEKKVIIFDLDGTLAESKQSLDVEMADLISNLLSKFIVGIISGASFAQFETQVLPPLSLTGEQKKNLFLMPTSGASLFSWERHEWKNIYQEVLSTEEVAEVTEALERAVKESGHEIKLTFGQTIENRGTQVTYSALGQQAPLELKSVWDPDQRKRQDITKILEPLLPSFNIRIGGTTSIDITRKGIDKGYGIEKLSSYLSAPKNKILFIGDALFPGGNDSAVAGSGIETVSVKNVSETKKLIRKIL